MTEMLNRDSRPQDDPGLTHEVSLHRAIEAYRPRFAEIGLPVPGKLHVSVGFGYSSRAESKYILGQCWARRGQRRRRQPDFPRPPGRPPGRHAGQPAARTDPRRRRLRIRPQWRLRRSRHPARLPGTDDPHPPGIELAAEVITLAEALGRFPHARLDPAAAAAPVPAPPGGAPAPDPGGKVHSGPGKQGTRMIKLAAAGCCGYTVRTTRTRKWVDHGYPLCPTASTCPKNDPPGHRPEPFNRPRPVRMEGV
jgi:hypothetical protein